MMGLPWAAKYLPWVGSLLAVVLGPALAYAVDTVVLSWVVL
jgi:hypothetical protein